MNSLNANFSVGDFLGNYRIESIISFTPETIVYMAEDMRKSVQVMIQQHSQPKDSVWSPEMILDVYQKCSCTNIAQYQDILFENEFLYLVFRKPYGMMLDTYIQLNPILNETEINNLFSTLLSIFIILAKHDWMVESIPFQHIYREDTGVYTVYGLLPIQKRNDYNDHYIALLKNIAENILVFEHESGVTFSESFIILIKRISSMQFKTIAELAPLFKMSGSQKINYECEPIVCQERTYNEKYFYLVLFVAVALFVANLLISNTTSVKDNITLPVKANRESQSVLPIMEQPPIPTAIPNVVTNENNHSNVKNEIIENVEKHEELRPIITEKYVDYGEYIQDRKTGLLWQKDGMASGKLNFYQAKEYAIKLKLGNVQGWRVPTIKELESIFPALEKPFINTPYTDQKCCKGPYEWHSYWTSEMDNSMNDYAFVYHWYQFGGANNCYASKNFDYVRCVHDPL